MSKKKWATVSLKLDPTEAGIILRLLGELVAERPNDVPAWSAYRKVGKANAFGKKLHQGGSVDQAIAAADAWSQEAANFRAASMKEAVG